MLLISININKKMTNLFESDDRNKILRILHNTTIPSFAVWMQYDIDQETKEERNEWWSQFESHPNIFIQNTAIFWIKLLENNIYYNRPD